MPHRNYHTGWIHWEVSGGSATGSRWRSDWRLFWQPEDIPPAQKTGPSYDNVDLVPTSSTGSGRPKVWTGAAWVQKPLKVWSGSAWVEKPVKVWDGTQWKTLT